MDKINGRDFRAAKKRAIRALFAFHSLTQADGARLLGVHRETVTRWMRDGWPDDKVTALLVAIDATPEDVGRFLR